MKENRRSAGSGFAIDGFFFLALTGLVIVPILAVLARASALRTETLVAPETLALVRLTVGQALASLSGALVLGVPIGYAFGRRFTLGWAQALTAFFAVPTLLTALAFAKLLAATPIGYSLGAVIATHIFLNAPWIALAVAERRHAFPRDLRESARVLGAGAWRLFRDHELPFLRPVLFQAGAQVFVLCAMSFVIVLLLGGGPPVGTLETEIYARIRLGDLDLGHALAFAFWQLVICVLPSTWALYESRRARAWNRVGAIEVPRGDAGWAAWAFVALLFLPYLAGMMRGLTAWGTAFSVPEGLPEAVVTSLALASAATALTVILAFGVVLRAGGSRLGGVVAGMAQLPSGVSVLVLCLGFWLAYSRFFDPFEGSWTAIVLLQVAVALPWAVRRLLPLAQTRDELAQAAARTLGANPRQAWFVAEWPRWKGPLLSVAALAFSVGLGEVAAVSFFASESLVPLSLLLSRWSGQYRFTEASQGFVVLFCLCLAVNLVTLLAGKKRC